MKIAVINGPNLNLLGKREPEVYGSQDFEAFLVDLRKEFGALEIDYFQSNVEGELINAIQEFGYSHQGIVLNAGAYTHTSVGIADAVAAVPAPVIEVHISNTYARESFRHQSYIAPNAKGIVIGFGLSSYRLALQSFL
ncbi:MAG: type II 3-dehydroquinate dehydratase [Flavobacteriaceae bacterium]